MDVLKFDLPFAPCWWRLSAHAMFGQRADADAAIAAALGAGLSAGHPDVNFTEADMDDPDLAAELAAVLGESIPTKQSRAAAAALANHGSDGDAALRQQIGAKKKLALQLKATDKKAAMQAMREAKQLEATLKARPSHPASAPVPAAAAQLSLEAAMIVAVGSGPNPDSVTLSEADMHDPELLAELAAISGGDGGDGGADRAGGATYGAACGGRGPNASGSRQQRAGLEGQLAAAKAAALQARRVNDRPLALQKMRECKQIEAEIAAEIAADITAEITATAGGRAGGTAGRSQGVSSLSSVSSDLGDRESRAAHRTRTSRAARGRTA